MPIRNNWTTGQTLNSGDLNAITDSINLKYEKPSAGVPKSDLATAVQNLLGANTTSVPLTKNSTGSAGQIAANGTHLYICVATNTWRRVTLSAW
jgi:hypothetical protein